ALGAVVFKKMARKCPPLWFHYHHIENETQMRIFKSLPKYADGITVDTDATLVGLEKLCPDVKGRYVKTIKIGTDTDLFKPDKADMKIRNSLGIGKNDIVVLFVGHLIHRKGIDILMESWKNVCKDFKNAHLILIGRGPLESLVKRYKETYGNIHIVPYVPTQKDLAKYYNISDVFAFPTRLEGHGMTAAEAMACGMPVVTTNAAGVRRFVLDGKTGYKVNIDDVKQFTEKLKILLSDDSLRKRMGRAARRHIEENWTWDVSIDQTEKFMEKVVNRK
ncbi:MAG: glycosyltransferase family 4 protein, partial [Candidatus Aenigmarchaeota archaeon]|nr:glycosyltransferase family 4 protein [Candidatus Aenigmarchaeota archaeon]